MPGYVITSVFEVKGGKLPLGADALAGAWGLGHRFSYCDGRMLTIVVELTAIDTAAAFESVLSRAELVWQRLGHEPLGPPVTLRVQGAVEAAQVPAGIPPADDTPPSARGRRRAIAKVARELRFRAAAEHLLADHDQDEPPDDGGLAGVREPRRPKSGPPGLHTTRDLPSATEGLPDDGLRACGLPDAVGM
jgi:hypothetical protein